MHRADRRALVQLLGRRRQPEHISHQPLRLRPRQLDKAAQWRLDKAAEWRLDKAAKWRLDKAAQWRLDKAAQWRLGKAAQWRLGEVAQLRLDKAAKWRMDKAAQWRRLIPPLCNLQPHRRQLRAPPYQSAQETQPGLRHQHPTTVNGRKFSKASAASAAHEVLWSLRVF